MQNIIKKIAVAASLAGIASVASAATPDLSSYDTPAQATPVTGNTQLYVTIPEVLVLYHWDYAVINLNNNVNRAIVSGSGQKDEEINAGSTEVTGDLDPVSPLATAGNKMNVTLKDSWAVRSITTSGKVGMKVENDNSTLKHRKDEANGGSLTTSEVKLASNATTSTAAEIELPSKWEPTKGDIKFVLDLSNAKKAGVYTSADTFKLTLSSK
ncbi:hypothetical protein LU293_06800 [Moraxella nasovis]|uniref:hypothetical protein n=1 Tax=Moraxella nasovis TaxID=2904121 RepID=UPI001F607B36|nr:hypothetical protein [Moraxella nasovis]UNU72811.1 hypothetical protein LU293_06800 [Moraxella nasovis]